jgi:tetratricopeptide (TPR) repeat protein
MLLAMEASLLTRYFSPEFWLSNPLVPLLGLFQLWMFVHALRQREWIWAAFIIFGFGLAAVLYFFLVFRETPSATRGFELPGAHHRRRIKELQGRIHHLDKAHHHSQLADIYFQQGKLNLAETSYRAALERDPQDIDTRAHFGQCLLRQGRPAEARPLLEGVITENPKHDYGYSQMALAETLAALGETDSAIGAWKRVTEAHSYPRAKVQLAELYLQRQQPDSAIAELDEVLADDPHAPAFQRRRDRPWVRRARRLRRKIA